MKSLATLCLLAFATVFARAADTGTLKGVFKYDGEPPKPKVHNINKDKAGGCPHEGIVDQSLIVDPQTRAIKWGIVRVMDVPAAPLEPQKPVEISQEGCKYTPRVVLIAPATDVVLLNPDKLPHNTHNIPMEGINQPIGRMIPANQERVVFPGRRMFAEPELIMLQCDIHPWMKGFVVVHAPRFAAITAEDGKFEIKNIPVGKYKVLFNHDLGEQEKEFEIKAGTTIDVGEILFKLK